MRQRHKQHADLAPEICRGEEEASDERQPTRDPEAHGLGLAVSPNRACSLSVHDRPMGVQVVYDVRIGMFTVLV